MLYEAKELNKTFGTGEVIKDFSLDLAEGEFVALLGKKGAGMTTLLQMMTGLTRLSSGEIYYKNKKTFKLYLNFLRRKKLSYVPAEPVLVGDLNIIDNIMLGFMHTLGRNKSKRRVAKTIIKTVGLKGKGRFSPDELNFAEKQRASLGMALIKEPDIVFCDCIVDSLEGYEAEQMMALLAYLNKVGYTIVLGTHSKAIAQRCHRFIEISTGLSGAGTMPRADIKKSESDIELEEELDEEASEYAEEGDSEGEETQDAGAGEYEEDAYSEEDGEAYEEDAYSEEDGEAYEEDAYSEEDGEAYEEEAYSEENEEYEEVSHSGEGYQDDDAENDPSDDDYSDDAGYEEEYEEDEYARDSGIEYEDDKDGSEGKTAENKRASVPFGKPELKEIKNNEEDEFDSLVAAAAYAAFSEEEQSDDSQDETEFDYSENAAEEETPSEKVDEEWEALLKRKEKKNSGSTDEELPQLDLGDIFKDE